VLHWHLTEDQGWRIEIPEYPRLTEVGAWRTEADGSTYGGYYTQAEIREVVEYARRRNVTVVPEIEMPGHSQAAVASYPELGCTEEPVPVAIAWGVMKEIYCVGNERTFTFLEDVLDEVMALFPSMYIHIGGDEVPKDRWKSCSSCQALMKREGLKDEAELQSWFVRRIERHLDRHGRKLIGWDEILEGGLPGRATVQVWRDTAHVTTAVRLGNAVIVSPTSHAYFDASPRNIPLERVYEFNPVPGGLDSVEARLVLGGEANLWTEYITTANFDLMVFPRLLAMAEVLWSKAPRDYQGFRDRLREGHYPRLRALNVGVGPEDRDVVRLTIAYDSVARTASVDVEKNVDGLVVRFTTDGSKPSAASPEYVESIRFSDPGTVTVQPFLREEPLPLWRTFTVVEHIARGRPVMLATANSNQYPGTGPTTLTDGLLGSTNHHDGLWQGWIGSDLEAVIDLGEKRLVRWIGASFLQATGSWILLPKSVAINLSDDGVRWRPAAELMHDVSADRDAPLRQIFEHELGSGSEARFVRIVARNPGALPAWHPGAGRPSWIFADEIIVR
jgi:hexosaminidase